MSIRKTEDNKLNQELKFKMHSIYGQMLVERKLMIAWEQVKGNKGSGGMDGVTIESYKNNEEENIKKLLERLKEKTYKPTPVRRVVCGIMKIHKYAA